MTMRATMCTLITTGALALIPAAVAQASAADWHFVRVYRSLNACQVAGQSLVAHRQAHEYRCENDYDKAGVPVLDLYTR
jgi:hypothetical protein